MPLLSECCGSMAFFSLVVKRLGRAHEEIYQSSDGVLRVLNQAVVDHRFMFRDVSVPESITHYDTLDYD